MLKYNNYINHYSNREAKVAIYSEREKRKSIMSEIVCMLSEIKDNDNDDNKRMHIETKKTKESTKI